MGPLRPDSFKGILAILTPVPDAPFHAARARWMLMVAGQLHQPAGLAGRDSLGRHWATLYGHGLGGFSDASGWDCAALPRLSDFSRVAECWNVSGKFLGIIQREISPRISRRKIF